MLYGGRCWFTYDFYVTAKFGGERYIGYAGYKVCDPALNNPTVSVRSDLGYLYEETAPDDPNNPDFYGEKASIGNVDPSWIRFWIYEENLTIMSDNGDIPPEPPFNLGGLNIYINQARFGITTDYYYGIDIEYYINNDTGYDLYIKGEVYREGTEVCESEVLVGSLSYDYLRIKCDNPGIDGEMRLYKIKLYASTDGITYHHIETRWIRVAYHSPAKTVGDIIFRPNRMTTGLEDYTGKVFRNYGRSGAEFDYVLMICSVDSSVHWIEDDLGRQLTSRENKCRWMLARDVYPLGVNGKNLYMDDAYYKTVNVYGYGDGHIRRVQSVDVYRRYSITADKAVVKSIYGDFAFDYVDGTREVDVSQAYDYGFLIYKGFEILNNAEFFEGIISDGDEYVKDYDRNSIKVGSISGYSGMFRVLKNNAAVYESNIDIPAGGEHSYSMDSVAEWAFQLSWGAVAYLKQTKIGTQLSLTVTPL